MTYKNKIYDITALEMFKRMDVFLNENIEQKKVKGEKLTVEQKIEIFDDRHNAAEMDKIRDLMHSIRIQRNEIVHPPNEDMLVRFCPHPVQVLDLADFEKFHNICFELNEYYPDLRMNEILIPTLEYGMGNAGDIIKHGLLAEFVRWYQPPKDGDGVLKFADSFGGSPWGNMTDNLWTCLINLRGSALSDAYSKGADKYLGSSHLVRRVAAGCGKDARIYMSDENKAARYNLETSVQDKISMELIQLPRDNDGYAVLYGDYPPQYDLILIDPYSDFLRDEFYKNNGKHFPAIMNAVKENPDLFLAVFVLDMDHENEVGEGFAKFKRRELAECAFSIRCPKRITETKSRFNSEMLLISGRIASGECGELYDRLQDFTAKAAKALPLPAGKSLELWGARHRKPDDPETFDGK